MTKRSLEWRQRACEGSRGAKIFAAAVGVGLEVA